jgi:predicted HTH domain antitoxin
MSVTKSVQVNLRVSGEVASDLDTLAAYEHVSRVVLARQILLDGIASRKQKLALRLYREGKVNKSRAAEIAGISLWEMMDLIDQAALPASYTLEEALEDVRRLVGQVTEAPQPQ